MIEKLRRGSFSDYLSNQTIPSLLINKFISAVKIEDIILAGGFLYEQRNVEKARKI